MRFAGKVAIVTGAGSGIGEAIARRLAGEGARLVLAGRTASKLDSVAEAICIAGGEAFGQLDVLVNNAGSGTLARITEMKTAQWREVMATYLDSIFFACRAAIPHLKAARGNIVNIASISGMGADHEMSAYDRAKGGVINFTRSLAIDCAEDGIRANSVSPGLVQTPTMAGILSFSGPMWDERIPVGRAGQGDEVAAGVAYLASDDATYVTRHNLVIDGGLTAQTGQPSLIRLLNR